MSYVLIIPQRTKYKKNDLFTGNYFFDRMTLLMATEQGTLWPQMVLLANPRGFCAGVVRAVDTLQLVVDRNRTTDHDAITYAYHPIIHNRTVVAGFEEQGVKFIDDIQEVPDGASIVYSAHGVSPSVKEQARLRRLDEIDAICPLVEGPHRRARRLKEEGCTMFYIGHAGHDETVGVLGEAPDQMVLIETVADVGRTRLDNPDLSKIAYLTQTTLSQDDIRPIIEALERTYPGILPPPNSDICYATLNRQRAIESIVKRAPRVVVVGSPTSSNSRRLAEVVVNRGGMAFLVDDASELDPAWFIGTKVVGITAGASAPEDKFKEVVAWFQARGTTEINDLPLADGARDESRMHFALPKIS